MNITFTDEPRIREAAARLLAEELDEETRTRILREAFAAMLLPPESTFSSPVHRSLHHLFTQAMFGVMQVEIQRMLAADTELVAKIRTMLHSAMDEFLTQRSDALSHALADAFLKELANQD